MLKSKMRSENPKELLADINVTPLVDVCLVLVIIFMVTTAMFLQPPFEITLPQAKAADQGSDSTLFVAISPDDRLALNESPVTFEEFDQAIRERLAQNRARRVVIRADAKVLSKTVLRVLDAIKQAGAQRISFGTQEEK